ncbi:hypothetical protein HK102_004211 [Quaeritorhiza haematococci]|nr:hypothetical protein HK102_004211 [Quaeritorhiza haematococci]
MPEMGSDPLVGDGVGSSAGFSSAPPTLNFPRLDLPLAIPGGGNESPRLRRSNTQHRQANAIYGDPLWSAIYRGDCVAYKREVHSRPLVDILAERGNEGENVIHLALLFLNLDEPPNVDVWSEEVLSHAIDAQQRVPPGETVFDDQNPSKHTSYSPTAATSTTTVTPPDLYISYANAETLERSPAANPLSPDTAQFPYGTLPHEANHSFVRKGIALDLIEKWLCLRREGRSPFAEDDYFRYQRGRFKGETFLHLAAVAGHLKIVKILVEEGGISPNVQTDGAEFQSRGLMYYGTTPLSFAAVAGHCSVVRYLLEKGADPSIVDTEGNNVMHVLHFHGYFEHTGDAEKCACRGKSSPFRVIRSFLQARQRFSKEGEAMNKKHNGQHIMTLRNREGLTPFMLAIKKGHVKVLDTIREDFWKFGKTSSYIFPVDEIDTWVDPTEWENQPRSIARLYPSALQLAVKQQNAAMVSHPALYLVLRVKWEKFAKRLFLVELYLYLALMFSLTGAIVLLPPDIESRVTYPRTHDRVRMVFEIIAATMTGLAIMNEFIELRIRGFADYVCGSGLQENFTQWFLIALLATSAVCRFVLYLPDAENVLLGAAAVVGYLFLFTYAKGFRAAGPLVMIFFRMLTKDIFRWLLVYLVVFVGFSLSLYLQFLTPPGEDRLPSLLGNGTDVGLLLQTGFLGFRFLLGTEDFDSFVKTRTRGWAAFLFVTYIIATSILLINLLIAMLNNSFTQIYDEGEKAWQLEWAS